MPVAGLTSIPLGFLRLYRQHFFRSEVPLMHPFHGQSGWLRLAILVAVVGQLPTIANADTLITSLAPVPLETAWISPSFLIVEGGTHADPGEPLPFYDLNVFPGELFAADNREPALEFSVNPADAEVLVGWRFEF